MRVTLSDPTSHRSFEFDEFTLEPPSAAEFTLASAGLAGLETPGVSQSRSHTGYWLLGAGGLALGLAGYLMIASSRAAKAKAERDRTT